MQQTTILERTTPPDETGIARSKTESALNVALVYQDTPAREWAIQVCDQVTRLAGKDAVRSTEWEISRFSDNNVLTDAVQTAMTADVILVSIYDAEELQVDFRVWIDAWLPRRSLPTGFLIALIYVPEQPDTQGERAHDYLRAVARKGRLDFMFRERQAVRELDYVHLLIRRRVDFMLRERQSAGGIAQSISCGEKPGMANPTISAFQKALYDEPKPT